jgi:hypothetical protein
MGNYLYKSTEEGHAVENHTDDSHDLPMHLTTKTVIEDPILWTMFESEIKNGNTYHIQSRLPIWKPSKFPTGDFSLLEMSRDLAVWTEIIFAIESKFPGANSKRFRDLTKKLVDLIAKLHTNLRQFDQKGSLPPIDHLASEAIINSCNEIEKLSLKPGLTQHVLSALITNYRQTQVEYMIQFQKHKELGSDCQAQSITLTMYDYNDKKTKKIKLDYIKSLSDLNFKELLGTDTKIINEIDFGPLSISKGKDTDLWNLFITNHKHLRHVNRVRFTQTIGQCVLIKVFNQMLRKNKVNHEMSNYDSAHYNLYSFSITQICDPRTHDRKGGIQCGCYCSNWCDLGTVSHLHINCRNSDESDEN